MSDTKTITDSYIFIYRLENVSGRLIKFYGNLKLITPLQKKVIMRRDIDVIFFSS